MAQVTMQLVDEQRARHARGEHFNLTINEEEQLLFAFTELQRFRMIARMRELCEVNHAAKVIAQQYGLGMNCSEALGNWTWLQAKAESYPYNAILNIFTVVMATKPVSTTEVGGQANG